MFDFFWFELKNNILLQIQKSIESFLMHEHTVSHQQNTSDLDSW